MSDINTLLCIKLLENSTSFVILLDQNQTIFWINQSFCHFLKMERKNLIGLSEDTVNEDCLKQIISKTIRVNLTSGMFNKWIELGDVMTINGSELGYPEQKFTVHYYNDVSKLAAAEKQHQQLENTLVHKLTHDSVTSMLNHQNMVQTLNSEVSRSRRYNNPLSMILMTIDYQSCSDSMAQEKIEQIRLMISQLLKDQMRWADIVGHLNEFDFVLLLPETVYESAEVLIKKINERIQNAALDSRHISYGISQWQKGDDVKLFLDRAAKQLSSQSFN
ncbi:MAG: diguanylate cyclase [gamma proteobacterium symbiont of Bathyaustriella thionipta]|nr:diguanylate cyclase [gamma proteobacterium symbiont of Bathyaustriella thionipta]